MSGVKGKSGGPRPGSGPKPKSIRLRLGDFVLINRQVDGKSVSVEGGIILGIARGAQPVITLEDTPGAEIKLVR